MFRQGRLAVHGLAILLGRNEAGISNREKNFLHYAVVLRNGGISILVRNKVLHWGLNSGYAFFARLKLC